MANISDESLEALTAYAKAGKKLALAEYEERRAKREFDRAREGVMVAVSDLADALNAEVDDDE